MKQNKKKNKENPLMTGIIIVLFGFMVNNLSTLLGGTQTADFLSGLMGGLSIGIMLYGGYVFVRSFRKEKNESGIDED